MYRKQYIEDTLRRAGIGITLPRLAIYDHLSNCHSHPSVDELYLALRDRFPSLSKTTVYNTLKLFVEKGLVRFLTIDRGEIRYDAELSFHGHFLCEQCKRIYNVPLPFEDSLDGILQGFRVNECEINFRGICSICDKKAEDGTVKIERSMRDG